MLIKGIDFPEELLRAQMAGELAIFAGAGVSNPPPSALPLFRGLADRVGAPSGVVRERYADGNEEPDDRYLGRLKKQGVQVHEMAARILVGSHTKPHEVHSLLLKVFLSVGNVRLVTTNFDTHFTTASAAAFNSPIETFFAPALPLGDDFTGLVYLHGSAEKDPKRCVLTDEDFGRAYLTQAWASRFLAAMFSKYAVLFVGYSHNDTVMNYLARGLPPVDGKRRFVFTADDNLSKWGFLGIHPMVYRLAGGENPHQAISESVGSWVADLRSGLLDKAQRIRSIAESLPPLEGEDADYIRFALTQIDTARVFLKHASLPEWINWLEKHGFIEPLFNPRAQLSQFERELASWLTKHFFTKHAHHLWAAMERNGGGLNPALCWCVWQRLCTRDQDASVGEVFPHWVAVLLTQPYGFLGSDLWGMLLNECHSPGDKYASVLLFDHLTKPRVRLKESWRFPVKPDEPDEEAEKVDFDLNILDEQEYWVGEAWDHLFKPSLPVYASLLEPVVTAHISAAHALQTLGRESRSNYDPFQFRRQSIEPHGQDAYPRMIDVLIDGAREILQHLLQASPREAADLIGRWFGSDIPMLRRLALHGFAQQGDITADAKLRWLLDNQLLYSFKTDVFWFLRQCYPLASESARRELVGHAMQGPTGELFNGAEERSKAYERFNLIVWLKRIAPECTIAEEALDQLKRQNPDFAAREHPDFDLWSSGVVSLEPTERFNVNEILTKEPAVFLNDLLTAKPSSPFDRLRSDYCGAAAAAVASKYEWGIGLVNGLVKHGLTDADLWATVCQGWRNASLAPEAWQRVLELAESLQAPGAFFEAFAEVLQHGARREQNAIPDDLMSLAQRVAERIWKTALEDSPPENTLHKDWLSTAINRPGGHLAKFWLSRVSAARRQAGESWKGIPQAIADSLKLVIRGSSGAAVHARVVLASQLHYFFSLDAPFAQAELLPLFDWKADSGKAEQCWHGFLIWGRWLPGFTEQLLPQFNETVNRAAQLPEDVRQGLVNHIAGLALFRIDNPLANGWFMAIVKRLAEPDLERLAWTIDRFLDQTATETAERVWTRWLKEYWKLRLLGTPRPLAGKEANETACWALSVGSYFPEAVQLIAEMGNAVSLQRKPLIYRIDEKGLAKKYPEPTADLVLLHLLRAESYFATSKHVTNVWQALRNGGVRKEKLLQIRDALYRLGHDPGEP